MFSPRPSEDRVKASEGDTKINLTFAQIAWFVTLLSAILWTWGDLRVQIAKLDQAQTNIEKRVERLEQRDIP